MQLKHFILLSVCLTLPFLCNTNFTSASSTTSSPITCISPEKKEVDWFVIFLFPGTSNKKSSVLTYGYYDNNSSDSSLKYYAYSDATFPGINLVEKYNSGEFTNYFFWNDDLTTEDGDKTSSSSSRAHSKGGLLFDKTNGFLFSHTLPRFPRRTSDNKIVGQFPSNAGIYAQTFVCISFNKENAIKVVDTLNIINPALVMNVEQDLTSGENPNPNVTKLIRNRFDSKLPSSKITEVVSTAGTVFKFFSKS